MGDSASERPFFPSLNFAILPAQTARRSTPGRQTTTNGLLENMGMSGRPRKGRGTPRTRLVGAGPIPPFQGLDTGDLPAFEGPTRRLRRCDASLDRAHAVRPARELRAV